MNISIRPLVDFLVLNLFTIAAYAACPTPPTAISPSISVKSSFDKKTSLYTYTYTISNGTSAKTGISRLMLTAPQDTALISAPANWSQKSVASKNGAPSYIQFSSITDEVAPRASLGGFIIRSKLAPGLVQYYVEGDPSEPISAVTVNNDDEVAQSCPGFYYSESSILDEMPTGQVLGPVSTSQVELKLFTKLKREHPAKGEDDESENLEISAIEKGRMEVIAFPSSNFDLSKIDLTSIKFGPGKASPTKASIVNVKSWPQHWRRKPEKGQSKFLVMEFNLSDLQIRCDADHSLFLNAVAGAIQVLGATQIQPGICTKDLWKKMSVDRKWPKRPFGD